MFLAARAISRPISLRAQRAMLILATVCDDLPLVCKNKTAYQQNAEKRCDERQEAPPAKAYAEET